MRGQLIPSLYIQAHLDDIKKWKPYQVFSDALHSKFNGNRTDDDVKKLIRLYLDRIGTPQWERTFKW
jgi:hypothetical protein